MKSKTIFTIDGGQIMKVMNDFVGSINLTRFVLTSKSGSEIINMSLLWVIVLAILLPFLTIIALVVGLIFSYKVSIQKEVKPNMTFLEK